MLTLPSVWWGVSASNREQNTESTNTDAKNAQPDTLNIQSEDLAYPFKAPQKYQLPEEQDTSGLYLRQPANVTHEIIYDPETGDYIFQEKIGDYNYRIPQSMSLDDYRNYDFNNSIQKYWRQRINQQSFEDQTSLIPEIQFGGALFNRIFGSNTITVKPQGFVELSFGVQTNKTDNPSLTERMRKNTTFDFDEKIQMNVTGQIGTKMKMKVNYNTEAAFDFENKMNLGFEGEEDDIIKRIEAGNVSMSVPNSLISGGSNLFGIRTDMQFGKLEVSTLFSQQKGETSVVETEGGAQKSKFEIKADQYDANRHFFLAQYFRDHYNEALRNLPVINSGVVINRVEVWVTNKRNNFSEARNIISFQDLGEPQKIFNHVSEFGVNPGKRYPSNDANKLYSEITSSYSGIRSIENINAEMTPLKGQNFIQGQDWEKIEQARKLSTSEYTLNENLGYISLRSALRNDEVLAVAFEYTVYGQVYQVGEFSDGGVSAPGTLILKTLKGTNLSPRFYTWDLMMKNVYNIGASQLSNEDFELNILYRNDSTGNEITYLPSGPIKGSLLLRVMNLDNLNNQLDPSPNGRFDFIEDITVQSSSGRIIFPILEPFGSHLTDSLGKGTQWEGRYVFQTLYDSTQVIARQDAEHNKFWLSGSFKGASTSEISLNTFNVTRGSVKVTAGGRELTENVDYIVDYLQGKVKIINQALLEAGTPITVSTESEDMFSMQTKTLIGTHLNYNFSDDFNLGATMMYLSEKPLQTKVNYGDEPISNTMIGLNGAYKTETQGLTSIIDALPIIETKETSNIAVEGEYARLFPGHSKYINGATYIDDFEGTKTSIDMRNYMRWFLASTPENFPEKNLPKDSLATGYNRAKLAWYSIDPLFLRNTPSTPGHIRADKEMQSNHYMRDIYMQEIYPFRETTPGMPTYIQTFDLAFYPDERGPYNFDKQGSAVSKGTEADGSLRDPETRWGGIMREIETSDFESANIEYIEFWMMDPFIYDTITPANSAEFGGDLIFHLGDISEDILPDSRKSFEHGNDPTGSKLSMDRTPWGYVSRNQSMVTAFDNDPASRTNQDVGYDGLNNDDENQIYAQFISQLTGEISDEALQKLKDDPASDNFHYFRGSDYDEQKLSILERYKYFNGPDGNSPSSQNSPESYPTAGTTIPNIEDINEDNTLNELENYYQYRVSLSPDSMKLGANFITGIKSAVVELKNGEVDTINWYQFKIPVKKPNLGQVGQIYDFRSIRFMRMLLQNFRKDIVLRFATLELVRSDWRRYDGNLVDNATASNAKLEVSAVNIEEDGNRSPVNYVLPPGIDRVVDQNNPQLRQLNEQSMLLKVADLGNGDARGAYKEINLDMRQFKHLDMEIHAEEIEDYPIPLNDDDLTVFLRLGSDYNNNYYEYEVPVKVTPAGFYYDNNLNEREIVWPEENRISIDLDILTQHKQDRNAAMRRANSNVTLTTPYNKIHAGVNDNKNKITIKGNPNLGEIEVLMIGVRNPSQVQGNVDKGAIIWVNELRLSEFDEKGGWAATGRFSSKLADLGTVSFTGRKSTAGFGAIDQNITQRSLEDNSSFDVSTNLQLGKFFGEKSGVKIPMYIGYSEDVSTPEYNPLDPDIKLQDALAAAPDAATRDSIKSLSQDKTTRKSINFTNVKIDKPKKKRSKPKIYDISNLSVTYSYNEINHQDENTEYDLQKNLRALLSYNYSAQPKPVEPFKKSKSKAINSPSLRWLRDFNIYLLPKQLSFRSDMNRQYNEVKTRNITNTAIPINETYEKDFIWNRYYDLKYDFSKNLQFDFSATNRARIDEPEGRINRHDDDYKAKRDSIIENILDWGRNTGYNHTFNGSYKVPLNKIPLLNWTSLSGKYQATYNWIAGPITDESYNLGNVINNSNAISVNGQANFLNLYNKNKWLKSVNSEYQSTSSRRRTRVKLEEVKFTDEGVRFRKNSPTSIFHRLGTEKVEVQVKTKDGKSIDGDVRIINSNRVTFTTDKNIQDAIVTVTGKVEPKENPWAKAAKITSRVLMSIRNVSVSYSDRNGTILPGFLPTPKILGSQNYTPAGAPSSSLAPGWGFVFGRQDQDFGMNSAQKGWITTDSVQTAPFQLTSTNSIDLRITLEPWPGINLDLTGNHSRTDNFSQFISYGENGWETRNDNWNGNFSMSVVTIKTAFEKMGESGVDESDAFNQFKKNRFTIANRLASQREITSGGSYNPFPPGSESGYPDGYGPNSPEVLIPAFLAAYTGQDAGKVGLDPMPSLKYIRPNWRLTYKGMVDKIPGLRKTMKSLTMSHAYRSTYSIGAYQSNLNYQESEDGLSIIRDQLGDEGNFLPKYQINVVSINEQFSPLFNLDMTWLNNMTSRFELRKSRNLSLSLSNNQLTEVRSNEFSFDFGYRFDKMYLFIKTSDSEKAISNDLNLRAGLSIRKNKTALRKLEIDESQVTTGQSTMTLKLTADYQISKEFTIRMFYDRNMNTPYVSNSYPTSNTNFGMSLKFSLTN